MKKRIRFFCLTLLAMVAGMAAAQDVVEIGTVDQLKAFRDAVNSGTSYAGNTVKLTADLDLSGEANWKPIGNVAAYPGQAFQGVFDGNGKTTASYPLEFKEKYSHRAKATKMLINYIENSNN